MNSPVTVSELSREIKNTVESRFSFVYVTGEISNFKDHSSGHLYFSLKDSKAQINAVIWNSRVRDLNFSPENGLKVIVKGRLTVYETRGTYQIDVFEMMPAGAGELQKALEILKKKLSDEGIFDSRYKKPLPEYPEKIALITSETGAAIHDFLKVTEKRYPLVEIILIPSLMQGAGSADSICSSVKKANSLPDKPEIIVITRGGGSIEDLWTFNEEKVARAVFGSGIPVVSAIGHEVDYTICDLAADMRAPTPSSAAELIFPDVRDLMLRIKAAESSLNRQVYNKFSNLRNVLANIERNYYFMRPVDLMNEFRANLDSIGSSILNETRRKLNQIKNSLETNQKLLNTLNPDNILKRGYTIIKRGDKIITARKNINIKDKISIKFHDGSANAVVEN
ncbi:MAG: exodeoxyribonuclease VII large subunit [Bacteroidetes bacterium]|nr:exodeoxyribonuclease VII large subunit [Bacteroidota bacterium]